LAVAPSTSIGRIGGASLLRPRHDRNANFLHLYGPNTNLGHNSIIFMLEVPDRLRHADAILVAHHRDLKLID